MNLRIAKKILKSKDKDQMTYSKNQVKKAETVQRRKENSVAKAVAKNQSPE